MPAAIKIPLRNKLLSPLVLLAIRINPRRGTWWARHVIEPLDNLLIDLWTWKP